LENQAKISLKQSSQPTDKILSPDLSVEPLQVSMEVEDTSSDQVCYVLKLFTSVIYECS
jgi:hypothetical protein